MNNFKYRRLNLPRMMTLYFVYLQKVKGRKPQHSVRLSFFYLKLVCLKDSCPVTGGTVPMSTEAIVRKYSCNHQTIFPHTNRA